MNLRGSASMDPRRKGNLDKVPAYNKMLATSKLLAPGMDDYDEYRASITPPMNRPDRLFRVNWLSNTIYSSSVGPQLPPEFVAAQGKCVYMIDLREDEEEILGPVGYIPGVDWMPDAEEARSLIVSRLSQDDPIILISKYGVLSGELANELHQEHGFVYLASMSGGMVGFKNLGFSTSRDKEILNRKGQLRMRPPLLTEIKAAKTENLTFATIKDHIGDPTAVRWMRVAALMLHGRISCVDGRDDNGVIGTPGGDAGEFVLLLSAAERITERPFTPSEVRTLLNRRLDTFGHFYIHTDYDALNRCTADMRDDPEIEPTLKNLNSPYKWRRFFKNPPKAIQSKLVEILVKPKNLGCGHLRLTSTYSEDYLVRKELIQEILRSVYLAQWSGHEEVVSVVLGGAHDEGGVINVNLDHEIASFTKVPLISPSFGETQSFINHPQVASFLRWESAKWMDLQKDILRLPQDGQRKLHDEMERIAGIQLKETLKYLANGLPVFDLNFVGADSSQVTVCGEDICHFIN